MEICKVLQNVKLADIESEIDSIINSKKCPLKESIMIEEAKATQHEIRLLNPIRANIKLDK